MCRPFCVDKIDIKNRVSRVLFISDFHENISTVSSRVGSVALCAYLCVDAFGCLFLIFGYMCCLHYA